MADVFISYAHNTLDRVTPISAGLEQAGFSLWWDKRLRGGDDFSLVIERELASAGCVLVAWSEVARNSLWVRAEATEALDAGKLVQIRLDGVKPPLPFTIVEMLDFTRWRGNNQQAPWPALESAARTLVGSSRPPDPRVFAGPALQDMGSAAALGWLSIGLVVFTSALTLQLGPGGLSSDTYRVLVAANFAVSWIVFALALTRAVRTAWASTQS